MNLLTVSDKECSIIYCTRIKKYFGDIDLAVSCGDLSYYYLEYIVSSLNVPLYYVRGNHVNKIEYGCAGPRENPWGAINLHKKSLRDPLSGLLFAGIEGSLRYNFGDYQYTQSQMWSMVMTLVPSLIFNKMRYGRYLDIFVSHAPPWGIHDQKDRAHQGIKAFTWLIKSFQPTYHLHGHVHVYRPDQTVETQLGNTLILNTYGYRKLALERQHVLQPE